MSPINFDALPTDKPNSIPAKGSYIATIDKAEMKTPKKQENQPQRPDYLSLQYSLKKPDGTSAGKLFDMLSESDHDLVRYKVGRFIQALEIPITGSFELRDLCKIIQGKTFIVDVDKDKKDDTKAVVDVFTNEIYYPIAAAPEIFGEAYVGAEETINASDAADGNAIAPADDEY